MGNAADTIVGIAAGAIMLVILLLVLATLSGLDPSSTTDVAESVITAIVYMAIIGVLGAVVLGLLSEI